RAASGKDETGRALRRKAGIRFSRLSPEKAHEWAHLGEVTPLRVLPSALACSTRDETGAAAREGADRPQSQRCEGRASDHRRPEPGATRLGQLLPHRQRCEEISASRRLRVATPEELPREASRAESPCGACRRLDAGLLRQDSRTSSP